ncbi:MAG: STAS domain-containing protein [Chromatiales bacterium]|nr:STAS domain-containing protein [Chromatiales bacterium]
MLLESSILEDGTTVVSLQGRMDVSGTQEIELPLTTRTAISKAAIIVDLSGVDFLASIGLRALVSNAKAQELRGGRMVLCNPQPAVEKVLASTGIDTIIPVFRTRSAAQEYLLPVLRKLRR